MITKFTRLEFELFTKPSKSDFLRVYQSYYLYEDKLSQVNGSVKHLLFLWRLKPLNSLKRFKLLAIDRGVC